MTCELCHVADDLVVELSTGLRCHPACFYDYARMNSRFADRRFCRHRGER